MTFESCHTSRGEVGRKRRKTRRHELRLARRRGELPAPSELEKQYRNQQASPASEAAAA